MHRTNTNHDPRGLEDPASQSESEDLDPDFWIRVVQGDEAAWETVFRRLADEVRMAVGRSLYGPAAKQDNSDYVQSAFRTVFRRCQCGSNYDISSWEQLTGLLIKYAWNKARKHLKKKRPSTNFSPLEEPGEGNTRPHENEPLRQLVFEEGIQLMNQSFCQVFERISARKMDMDNFRTLVRFKLDGQSNKQIARECGISERTVRRWWQRFESLLKEELGGEN